MRVARLSLTALTLLSSLGAFAAYTLLLRYLGASSQVDQYFYAASVPTGVSGFLAAVMLYMVPPRLVELSTDKQECAIRYMFAALMALMGIALVGMAAYAVLQGPSRLHGLILGFIVNAGLSLCGVLLVCRAQIAGAYVLVGVTQFVTVSGLLLGVCLSIATHDVWPMVVAQIAASLATVALTGRRLKFPFSFCLSHDRRVFSDFLSPLRKHLVYVLMAMTAFTMFPPIDAFLCAQLGGGALTIMAFAQRVWVAVGTLISLGAHTIATKTSHDAYVTGGMAALRRLANREVLRILATGVAVWVLYALIGRALLAQIFSFSAIAPRDVETLQDCISIMLMSANAMTAIPYVFRLFYTLKDYKGPALIGCTVPVVYGLCAWALLDRLGLLALPAALVVAWWLALLIAMARLNGFLWQPQPDQG